MGMEGRTVLPEAPSDRFVTALRTGHLDPRFGLSHGGAAGSFDPAVSKWY